MPSLFSEKRLSTGFAVLLAAFVTRVLMQLVQAVGHVPGLPAFERWQSGLLPYPALLIFQVVIVAGALSFLFKVHGNRLVRHRRRGKALLVLGILYLTFDIVRLVLGATVFRGHRFFDNPIPASFHVVLALMVLIWAIFHLKKPGPTA